MTADQLALSALADDELDAVDTAATWRAIARQAITELHDREKQIARLKAAHTRLNDEFRFVRADLMREKAKA